MRSSKHLGPINLLALLRRPHALNSIARLARQRLKRLARQPKRIRPGVAAAIPAQPPLQPFSRVFDHPRERLVPQRSPELDHARRRGLRQVRLLPRQRLRASRHLRSAPPPLLLAHVFSPSQRQPDRRRPEQPSQQNIPRLLSLRRLRDRRDVRVQRVQRLRRRRRERRQFAQRQREPLPRARASRAQPSRESSQRVRPRVRAPVAVVVASPRARAVGGGGGSKIAHQRLARALPRRRVVGAQRPEVREDLAARRRRVRHRGDAVCRATRARRRRARKSTIDES